MAGELCGFVCDMCCQVVVVRTAPMHRLLVQLQIERVSCSGDRLGQRAGVIG